MTIRIHKYLYVILYSSTLSSGFNSLSAITVVEFVKPWGKDLTDFKETIIAKAIGRDIIDYDELLLH